MELGERVRKSLELLCEEWSVGVRGGINGKGHISPKDAIDAAVQAIVKIVEDEKCNCHLLRDKAIAKTVCKRCAAVYEPIIKRYKEELEKKDENLAYADNQNMQAEIAYLRSALEKIADISKDDLVKEMNDIYNIAQKALSKEDKK